MFVIHSSNFLDLQKMLGKRFKTIIPNGGETCSFIMVQRSKSNKTNPRTRDTVDGSEIRRAPVEVGCLSKLFTGFHTCQVVFAGFLKHQQYDKPRKLHECPVRRSQGFILLLRSIYGNFRKWIHTNNPVLTLVKILPWYV